MEIGDRSAIPDYLTLLRLDDRPFVVIGAGQGRIGRQTAHALAQAGAHMAKLKPLSQFSDEEWNNCGPFS